MRERASHAEVVVAEATERPRRTRPYITNRDLVGIASPRYLRHIPNYGYV